MKTTLTESEKQQLLGLFTLAVMANQKVNELEISLFDFLEIGNNDDNDRECIRFHLFSNANPLRDGWPGLLQELTIIPNKIKTYTLLDLEKARAFGISCLSWMLARC
jgi:hypothetical protein